MKKVILSVCFLMVVFVFQAFEVSGQFYPFTYQGSLKDGNVPANGNYDIRLELFNVPAGGISLGSGNFTEASVVNGIFSLEFGAGTTSFFVPGLTYWVEVSVRPSGSTAPRTLLTPRQKITYTPYSISSILSGDSLKLGGADASQYVLTTDARLNDARAPTAGSTSYIQNRTTAQPTSNFNISGNGEANILNAQTEYQLGGTRILRRLGESLFVGVGAGSNTTSLFENTFVGTSAGGNTTTGQSNSFFGKSAGLYNQTGGGNSFFGTNAGSNQLGNNNSIFGSTLGFSNPFRTGDFNAFFGHRAGQLTSGSFNSFLGTGAGFNNDSGASNTFVGRNAGDININGSFNTALGEFANFNGNNLTNATAIGAKAFVSQSNSLVLGSINGVNGATADTNVGIGTTTPNTNSKLHVNGTVRVTNGGIFIANPNTVVITSPNGACWGITVNNSGGLATFPVTPCP